MSNNIAYVSLDPGLHHFGVALWSFSGELIKAKLIVNYAEKPNGIETGEVVANALLLELYDLSGIDAICEIPQVYTRDKSKGNPNTLVQLACAGSFVLGRLKGVAHTVLPAEWKGQLPKGAVEERCKQRLSEVEKARIVYPIKSLRHNVWDAIGIGLFFLEKRVKIRKPPEKKL